MPAIPVSLADVETFESLPEGKYLGDIDSIKFQEATQPGKFPQLKVTYVVVDGDELGRKQSEWLSMSPKAAFRLRKWFDRFGFGQEDYEQEEWPRYDEDTMDLIDPDLVGARVIFKVYADGKKPGTDEDRWRTELVSVEDDEPAPAPRAKAKAAPAPAEEEEEDDEPEPDEKPARRAPARRPVPSATQKRTLR